MAQDQDLESREMSDSDSNDDAISVTSTAVESEYLLEENGIWAERENDGVTEYLVKWEGYPEEENTWQTKETFNHGEDVTFQNWEAQKMRISRGYIKPFNIEEWERKRLKWEEATQKRRWKRRNKRIRLGLPGVPLEFDPDEGEQSASDEVVSEAESDDDHRSTLRQRSKRRRTSLQEKSSISFDSRRHTPGAKNPENPVKPSNSRQPWDSRQQNALMNGLERLKGPRWSEILSMHRSVLKTFTASDLEDQAQVVKNQFKESGRRLPAYLECVPDKQTGKRHNPRSRTHSIDQNTTKQIIEDSAKAPVDSHMRDTRRKSSITSREDNKDTSATDGILPTRKAPEKSRPHNAQSSNKAGVQQNSATVQPNEDTAANTPKAAVNQEARVAQVSTAPPFPVPQRRGPARTLLRTSAGRFRRNKNPALNTTSYVPKKAPVTGSVLTNWDKGTLHGNSSLSTKSKTLAKDGPEKVHDKYSIRRRMVKKGRTEPMPDMSNLELINLKDGTAVKDPIAHPQKSPTKTPYQLIQESRLNESPAAGPPAAQSPSKDNLWMEKLDDEIMMEPSAITSEPSQLTPFQAPQAMMKPVDGAQRRASIPLSAYTQRLQAPPPPPPSAPPVQTPSPTSPSTQPTQRQPDLQLRKDQQRCSEKIENPQSAQAETNAIEQSSQSPMSSVDQQYAQPIPPRNPKGLQQIIAGMGQNDDKMEQFHIKDPGDVFNEIVVGQESTHHRIRFRGLNSAARGIAIHNFPKRPLALCISQLCTAADYEAQFHTSTTVYLGSGFVVPSDLQAMTAVEAVAETLKLHVSCGVCHTNGISVVMYPVNSEDWAFLDHAFPMVPHMALRFVLRGSMQIEEEETIRSGAQAKRIEKRISRKSKAIGISSEQGINTVMRLLYDIEYSRLIYQAPQKNPSECAKFFLLFPKEQDDQRDLVISFLSANNASEIYTYNSDRNDAAWNYFLQHVEAGAIIAHSSFWQFHLIPHFAQCIRKSINVWSLSLHKDKNMKHPHLTRLFPHGCMLLLTDSLLLLQPLAAVRLLAWFRLKVLVEKPAGTWKIVTRPGLRNYCLNLCKERLDDEEGKRFLQIYEQLYYMLDADDLYDHEEDKPREEAPIYFMPKIKSFNTKVGRRIDYYRSLDHAAIARNDEVLIEFFAGWASCNIELYRRFHVVTGFEDNSPFGGKTQRDKWVEKYSFLEVFVPAAFHHRHDVKSQEYLDAAAAKKEKQAVAEHDRKLAEIDAAMKRDEEESTEMEGERRRNWQKACESNPRLKDGYEKLGEGWSEDGEREEEEEVSPEREWDEWSRDSFSEDEVMDGVEAEKEDMDTDMDMDMFGSSGSSESGDDSEEE